MSMTSHTLSRRLVAAGACAVLAAGATQLSPLGFGPTASALPPGGANTVDTEGTSSSVTAEVPPGGTVTWSVSGFPPGVPVYAKVDDGDQCPPDAAQGACVVSSKMVGSDGTATASFKLSSSVGEGTHWLRFLATGPAPKRLGYSNRSPDFTVTAGASDDGGTSGDTDASDGAAAVDVDDSDAGIEVDENGDVVESGGGGAAAAVGGGGASGGGASGGGGGTSGGSASGGSASGGSASGGTSGGSSSSGSGAKASGAKSTAAKSTATKKSTKKSGSSAAAAGTSDDGLTPYENLASSDESSTSNFPWAGFVVVVVAALLALAMLGSSILVTVGPTLGSFSGGRRRGKRGRDGSGADQNAAAGYDADQSQGAWGGDTYASESGYPDQGYTGDQHYGTGGQDPYPGDNRA